MSVTASNERGGEGSRGGELRDEKTNAAQILHRYLDIHEDGREC